MKTFHTNYMVAHLWAHKAQPNVRSNNGNFWFDGDTIYSYGRHFPIARHVTNERGESAVLCTTASHSVTTSAHCYGVRRAVNHLTIFHVPQVEGDHHADNLADYERRVIEGFASAGRARCRRDVKMQWSVELAEEANAYADFFGIDKAISINEDNYKEAIAAAKQVAKERAEFERVRREERQRLLIIDNADQIKSWLAGERTVGLCHELPCYLRIHPTDPDTIQTSQGAEFAIDHAKIAFKLIARLRDRGQSYRHNGHSIHLGPFRIDSINKDGDVKAGCHFVKWAQIEHVAKQLDLI